MDAENIPEVAGTEDIPEIDKMFETDQSTIEAVAAELAEHIAIEDDALATMDKELKNRKAMLVEAKEKLAEILMQAGLSSIKLESGLSPSVQVNRKFFKAAGVTDEQLFEWLRSKDLGGIIKPTVHYGTMQSTLKAYEDMNGTPPEEIFNLVTQKTIRMNGKAKYLANRQ